MTDIHAIWLAAVQGFTEFLPISSSAHLILLPRLLGWPDQGLAFDVAVHVGSLAAVLFYFRHELVPMIHDWALTLAGRPNTEYSKLAWAVVIGTIPLGIGGVLMKVAVGGELRAPLVIATTTIVFGLLLGWADYIGKRERDEHSLSWKDALWIGGSQVLALIPGTSRSGITITTALILGLTRTAAARFSFLLSIPAIILPGILLGADLVESPDNIHWRSFIIGAVMSAVFAYICIRLFLKMIQSMGMMVFVVYRLILGVFLFYLFL
ncbi:MAG: undecaprenyl-diphosphate phosphatase [Gammaproteobacteria bacterium]|nr:undecaprenyl-diphosphate phosphatase [Gammaproteobacteria bacterium]